MRAKERQSSGLSCVAIALVLAATAASGRPYFVSKSGSNGNTGTFDQPFLTIQKGLDAATQPNDSVVVRSGTYTEKIQFSHGGSSAGHISLVAYQSEQPIIDGTGNTFYQIQIPDNTSYIKIIGFTFQNFYAAPQSGMSTNEWCRNAAIQLRDGCSYVKILNNIIRDSHNQEAQAISARCYSLSAPITHLLIDGNLITRISALPGEVVTICGNVDMWQFSNNEMTDLPQGSNGVLDAQGGQPYGVNASPRRGLCTHNNFHDLEPDGKGASIYADGASNNVYDGNIFKNAGFAVCFGAEHASERSDSNVFQNNIMINCNPPVTTGMWSCCGDPYNSNQITHNKFLNNITYGGTFWSVHWMSGTIIYNNIFVNCGTIALDSAPGTLIDYNLYYNSDASGGSHSKTGDPLFVNAAAGDFHLTDASPAINAGCPDAGFFAANDYDGNIRSAGSAPDIGAFEYGASSDAPPIITGPSSLSNGSTTVAYSATFTAGGSTPITWSVSAGSLPAGMSLDAGTGTYSGTPTTAGTFNFTVRAANAHGNDTKSYAHVIESYVPPTQGAYGGAPRAIPGRIQAEDYDVGGEGVAYHDLVATNELSEYRTDDVDVETTTDPDGGGFQIGHTGNGEWLEYTVTVAQTGSYLLSARVASGVAMQFRISIDGTDATGAVNVASTGNWTTWTTATKSGISLTQGQHVVRFTFTSEGFCLNWLEFTAEAPTALPMANQAAARTSSPVRYYSIHGRFMPSGTHARGVMIRQIQGRNARAVVGLAVRQKEVH